MKKLLACLVLFLGLAGCGAVNAQVGDGDAALWSALQAGNHVVFIRHARTDPGIGDPAGFTLGDCRTQRNLSAQGRKDAEQLGAAFRSRQIPVAAVLSSQWCRCMDTARLAFGRVAHAPMLDSMFNDNERAKADKVRQVSDYLARHDFAGKGNLILVTHAVNIEELTGVSPASGEMVVTRATATGKLQVIGRLMPSAGSAAR